MEIKVKPIDIIDSIFIKEIRNSNGDTAEVLCKKIGVNKTSLYYAENGIKHLSENMLNKILSYYSVEYNRDNKIYDEAYDLTIELYDSFVFKDYSLLKKYGEIYFEKEECFKKSRAFIFCDLIEAIINLLNNRDQASLSLDEAMKYISLYDNEISCIYAIIYTFGKGLYKNINEVKNLFLEIYEKVSNSDIKPSVEGMMYYQLGKIKTLDCDFLGALKCYSKSNMLLCKMYCVERAIQTKIGMADVLLNLQLYNEAEKEYLNALEESRKHNYPVRIRACLNNLAYLYFVQRNYKDCELFVEKAKESGSTHPDINYYLAYCAYKTKGESDARSLVAKLLENEKDRYTCRMLKMIRGFINNNYKDIDLYFARSKKYLEKIHDTQDLKILYEMNIFYYMNKNQDRLNQLLCEYLNLKF